MLGRLRKAYNEYKLWRDYIFRDPHRHNIPFAQRLKFARKGFTGRAYLVFNLSQNNTDDYINEIERWRSRDINGEYKLILDDKFLFTLLFSPYIRTPKMFAWSNKGRVSPINDSGFDNTTVIERLREAGSLVIKPLGAGGGKGVALLKWKDDKFFINGVVKTEAEMLSHICSYDQSLITEIIEQSDYGNSLYPGSVNTVRIITARRKDAHEFQVVFALQRMGSNKTAPVDNFKSGGLAARIDLDTGILGKAITSESVHNKSLVMHDVHPDTGGQIAGVKVPDWESLKQAVLDASNAFPFLRMIAWDIAICPDGFCAIEANASAGLNSPQAFGGLRNSALGDVFRSYGIIR